MDLQCILVDAFHWPPYDLAKADIDMILPLAAYYPYWKSQQARQEREEKVFADEASWL